VRSCSPWEVKLSVELTPAMCACTLTRAPPPAVCGAPLQVVRQNWKFKPAYATSGSCALVGIIQGSVLYVAGVGDSKAVLATSEGGASSEEGRGAGEGEGVHLRAVELSEGAQRGLGGVAAGGAGPLPGRPGHPGGEEGSLEDQGVH